MFENTCPNLKQAYQSLLTLKDAFNMELKEATVSGDFSKLEELKQDIQIKKDFIESNLTPFEKEFKEQKEPGIKEQYEHQKNVLEENGLLETREGILGIEGIDGAWYPFPQLKDISKELRKNKAFHHLKLVEQKISSMRIEPFALPVMQKIEAFDIALKRHFQEGKLFARGTKELPFSDTTKTLEDMYVWEKYPNADINGSMVYDPEILAKTNHKGKTKKDILSQPMTFPGFRVSFVEKNIVIPRKSTNEAPQGNRKRIEAYKSSEDYLTLLTTGSYDGVLDPNNPYQGESPLSIDDWLIHALTVLEETNEVIDDYDNGKDSACLCPGSFFPDGDNNGVVSFACWNRSDRLVDAYGAVPAGSFSVYGFRASVRVG